MGAWKLAVAGIASAVILGLATTAFDEASAVRLTGTSSTALYTQEVAGSGAEEKFENRARLYERIRFGLTDFAGSGLSFHGFLTARNDLTNEAFADTRTRLYHAYLRYHRPSKHRDGIRLDTRLGRQWISVGVGSGTIDGAALSVDRTGWGGITLFAGTLGIDARDQWRFDQPTDSQRFGAEVRLRPRFREGAEPEVAASFADTRRNDLDESRRIGARASLLVRRQLRLWSQVQHDLHLDETFSTAAGIDFSKSSSGFRAWAEFHRRTPALAADSYFRKFKSVTKPITQLRGGLGFGLGGPYRIGFDFTRTDFKEETTFGTIDTIRVSRSDIDRAKSFRLFLERGPVRFGGTFQSGFGGDQTRFLFAASHEFGTRWSVDVDLGVEHYDYGPSDFDENSVRSGLIAAAYRPGPLTKVTAQIEGLDNRDLKRDVRLLVRIDQRFRLERSGRGVK